MIERKTCVFPDPLSPTTPSASPGPIVNATPSAASTSPSGVAKRVVRMTDDELLARRDIDFNETTAITDAQWGAGALAGDASIHIARLTNEEQRLRTESPSPFLLASSEKLTPELRITIDGRTARAIEINSLFAGVEVPAGTHRVVFQRRIGRGWWWATIAGAIAFAAIAVVELFMSSRARARDPGGWAPR